jgi:Pyridoxamine 5'-phosphate oxidase
MIDASQWNQLRPLFADAFASSLHFAVASVDDTGAPLVTPIGSLLLAEPGHAVFFEVYAHGLAKRLAIDPRVSVLAVDAGKWRWLRALATGSFAQAPAVRLVGRAAAHSRESTEAERARWWKRVGVTRWLPGSRTLWPNMAQVRDVWIDRLDPMALGAMTRQLGQRTSRMGQL